MNKIDELIAFHLRAAESCEAFAVTPDADKAKNKDIAKHYQKTAAWHREAVEALRAADVRAILLDVVPGDGSGHEVYAGSVADVEAQLNRQGEVIEDLESKLANLTAAPKPPPTITVRDHRDDQSALALVLQEELDRPRGFTD